MAGHRTCGQRRSWKDGRPRRHGIASRTWRLGAVALVLFATPACERGCAWGWLRQHGAGEGREGPEGQSARSSPASGSLSVNAIDCPDGLARCLAGNIEASHLTAIPWPCHGPASVCACPWEHAASCANGCVVDGLELAMERGRAAAQLCALGVDAGPLVYPSDIALVAGCDEGQLYRCSTGAIIDCALRKSIAHCVRGCAAEEAFVDDGQPVRREAAFAILCSR
jgi:hypothetical protein